jgi:hypothetical protein
MFGAKVVEKIETHLTLSNFFSEHCTVCAIMWKNMVEPDLATDDKVHALCMLDN